MSTFKNKNSLRTIVAQIVQKLKNNEVRPKFTGSYKKKACICLKILVSFTARFLGSCFYLIYPSKIQKSLSTKQLISTFPSTNCITLMSFSNAKIIYNYTMITSFNVKKMSLDRALCS